MNCPKCGAPNPDNSVSCASCNTALTRTDNASSMQNVAFTSMNNSASTQNTVMAITYAGFWKRFAASILDGFILMIPSMIVGFILGFAMTATSVAFKQNPTATQGVTMFGGYILGLVVNLTYFTLFESSSKQATPGKMALGIIVTDMDGNRLSAGKAFVRNLAKILSSLTLTIGYLMAGFTDKKQALHDMVANALVVDKR